MTAPTAREVAEVDAGINVPLTRAAAEPRHEDPALAELQVARDEAATRGDFSAANHFQRAFRQLEMDEGEQEVGG